MGKRTSEIKTAEHLAWEFFKKRFDHLQQFAGNRSLMTGTAKMIHDAWEQAVGEENERGKI